MTYSGRAICEDWKTKDQCVCVVTNCMESKKIDLEDTKDFFWMKYVYEEMVWKMGRIAFASQCLNSFLCEWGFCNAIELESNKDVRTYL